MSFVEDALSRAGLMGVLVLRRQGDLEGARAALQPKSGIDLLPLGALADLVRAEEVGDVVRIHTTVTAEEKDVVWIDAESDLDLLRGVALARIAGARGCRVGIDWSRRGLELAQVALGFGASDLRGAITKKSGLPILETEARKVKGQGMVELSALKKREIATLVQHARRVPVFVAEDGRLVAPPPVQQERQEAAGV